MENFKGTKGKWYLQEYTDAYTNIIRCDNGIHKTLYLASTSQCTNSEERYNAQIMAHAPEMLEMLQSLHHCIDWSVSMWGDDSRQVLKEKIEQLLQRATTI